LNKVFPTVKILTFSRGESIKDELRHSLTVISDKNNNYRLKVVGILAEKYIRDLLGGAVCLFLLSSYMEYIESIGFTPKILKNCFCSNHVFYR
jgi:hypothetical protein